MNSSGNFFDRFPRLRLTSATDVRGERLEYRYQALIVRNSEFIRGGRVLDLASHDGRWTLAALDSGATHVTGIEGRSELVEKALVTFHAYDVPSDRFTFITGDCLKVLENLGSETFDTVFCFGFLYHTRYHYDILQAITRLHPSTLLIDCRVVPLDEPAIYLAFNDPSLEGAAIAQAPGEAEVLVGIPTLNALLVMLDHLGWRTFVQPTLPPKTRAAEGVRDYSEGRRYGLVAHLDRKAEASSEGGRLV